MRTSERIIRANEGLAIARRRTNERIQVKKTQRLEGTWVNALSRGAASDAHGRSGKPKPAFQSAESDRSISLSLKDRILSFGARALLCLTLSLVGSWCAF